MQNTNPDDRALIQRQLDFLNDSKLFKASSRQKKFLRFIVQAALDGRTADFKEYTIAMQVFGRGQNFDSRGDAIVRVEAGRLRRALEHYYLTAGRDDPLTIDLPKGGYVPVFRHNDLPVTQPDHFAAQERLGEKDSRPSIAVMPVMNLSGDSRQEYIVNGLTEEICIELARYQGLRVIASQSSFRYKKEAADPALAGRELGVRFLLHGAYRRESDHAVRVSFRLLDTESGEQLWAERYSRAFQPDELIAVQEEIAARVVGVLADLYGVINQAMAPESRKKTPGKLETYDAILRFYHYEFVLTTDSFLEALSAMEQAVELEPQHGLAWSMLGHLLIDNFALGFVPMDQPLTRGMECAGRGLALDPESQFAWDTMAMLHFHKNEKELTLKYLEKSVKLNPNAPYLVAVSGWTLCLYGLWEQGLPLLKKGMTLNPFLPSWFYVATWLYHLSGNELEKAYGEAIKFNCPGLFWDPLVRAATLGLMGNQEEAKAAATDLLARNPDFSDQARVLVQHYIKIEEMVDRIIEGLVLAGVDNIS